MRFEICYAQIIDIGSDPRIVNICGCVRREPQKLRMSRSFESSGSPTMSPSILSSRSARSPTLCTFIGPGSPTYPVARLIERQTRLPIQVLTLAPPPNHPSTSSFYVRSISSCFFRPCHRQFACSFIPRNFPLPFVSGGPFRASQTVHRWSRYIADTRNDQREVTTGKDPTGHAICAKPIRPARVTTN